MGTAKKLSTNSVRLVPKFENSGINGLDPSVKKSLVGRKPTCDLIIDDESISSYHALIIWGDEDISKIIDLESNNGIFHNGTRVKEAYFVAGDTLTIGKIEFYAEETLARENLEDEDTQVEDLGQSADFVPFHEMPILPGLTLIDGEAVDLDFKDENFIPQDQPVVWNQILGIDTEYFYDTDKKLTEITKEINGECLEISVISRDSLIDVGYLPLRDGSYALSGRRKIKNSYYLDILDHDEVFGCIHYQSGKLKGDDFKNFSCTSLDDDTLRFSALANQIYIRVVPTPPHLKQSGFFSLDHSFNKELGKIFGVGVALLLLLIFIPLPEKEPPKKKVAVIYKMKAKTESNVDTAMVKQDNPENLKPMEKVKTQKAAPPEKSQPQKIAKTTKSQSAPAQKAVAQTVPKKLPQVDTYKNPFASSLKNLMAKSGDLSKVSNNKAIGSGQTSAATSDLAINDSQSAQTAQFKGKIGSVGNSAGVAVDSSAGAKGLVDKKGIVSTMMSTKTVVLGAIDPELLRKILQEYLPQFRHCYQQELELNSDKIKGVVDLQFTIDKNGRAQRIQVVAKKSRFSKRGTDCMSKVLSIIEFPQPKGGGIVDVRQPLNFYSEQG